MDLIGFYNRMGRYSLYDLRDEFLEWVGNQKDMNIRTKITDEVLGKIPDKYITQTRKKQLETELLIMKKLNPKAYKKAMEGVKQ